MDTEGGVAAVVGADSPAVQQNFGAGIDALELQPDFLRSCVERRSGKGGAVGAGAAPVIVAAVLAVFCVPSVGQRHQSGLAVRPSELPVLHELGDASHSFSSRVSVAFSLLCGRFFCLSLLFYQRLFLSQDRCDNRSNGVDIRFCSHKSKLIYLCISHKQLDTTRVK